MFQVDEYLIYKKDVCKIKDIKKQFRDDLDYFVLMPVKDESLKIEIPSNSKNIRKLLSKKEIDQIIVKIPSIPKIEIEERLLESEYKRLLNSGREEDFIQIMKTTYERNQKRLEQKKKIGDKDKRYFEQAENYLCQEFSVVLQLSKEETKEYIKNKIKNEKNILPKS